MRDSLADRDTTRIEDHGASQMYETDHLGWAEPALAPTDDMITELQDAAQAYRALKEDMPTIEQRKKSRRRKRR